MQSLALSSETLQKNTQETYTLSPQHEKITLMRRQQEEVAKMANQLQQRLDALEAFVNTSQAQDTNLQNKVNHLQNATAAAAVAAPAIPFAVPPAAAVMAPITYAENPGQYDVEQIINVNTRLGMTVYD